ncbi:MAG TPA: NAD(P)-dependent alcohol dehydrogenase [Vicinamibacterales bacterium]|nr:NAD(P)-dependent alcohol dehydrogenase [Vicinamibacterales bacterium]
MKAIVFHQYGAPDVLKYEEVDKPVPGDDQILLRVHAASVNPLDWHGMRGKPYIMRVASGLRQPKANRLGTDVAGQVEAAGRNVTRFKPGDSVFGVCRGAFSEYACARESALTLKPDHVTFEQAAAVPVAAFTALQGLRDKGRLQSGQKVLINGAAGGVGTFAVQIARSLGAEVTGVCSTRNVDLVGSIGADSVIDYSKEDFTTSQQRFDVIFDCMGNHSLLACRRLLTPTGTYVAVGGPNGPLMGPLAFWMRVLVFSRFVSQTMLMFIANPNRKDLAYMGELVETGKVSPVIERRYGLAEVPEAIRHLERGHARGKVIIAVRA